MSEREKQIRKMAKYKFIKLRNISNGVRAYLPNGVDIMTFKDWEETYTFILEYGS